MKPSQSQSTQGTDSAKGHCTFRSATESRWGGFIPHFQPYSEIFDNESLDTKYHEPVTSSTFYDRVKQVRTERSKKMDILMARLEDSARRMMERSETDGKTRFSKRTG